MLPSELPSLTLNASALPAADLAGLYVHVPFCFHKCHYCDFYSITRQTPQRMGRFVQLVLAEADHWITARRGIRPRTVFFGGGTPTLLPLEPMHDLIVGLQDRFDFSQCDEYTIEANPATVSTEYCRMLVEAGATRISFGAQSFDPAELALLERHHDPRDVPASVRIARDAGFKRINVDLIYALPGQTLERWMRSLESAIALETEHISCYGLTYEPNTPMAVRKRLGQFQPAEESLEIAMLRATRRRLAQAGLAAYEISNYARPGEECRHNLMYWTGGNYLGLGPAAASHIAAWRWRNRPHLGEWESAISNGSLAAAEVESLSPQCRAGELAMLTLRLERGLNYDDFAAGTGFDAKLIFADPIARFIRQGLLQASETAIRLTPAGLIVADGIASEFLAAADSVTA